MPTTFLNELRDSIDKPLSFTNRLLLQIDFARVDPYTIGFSRLACNYKTSISGERLFNHSLTNIPVYFAADDRLQFGWDDKAVWRNAALHRFEYEHLLLAAALGECLPEAYAAAVLHALGQQCEDQDRINPSLASWAGMVHSVNGLLTDTDFPLVIDERQRLDPDRIISGHTYSRNNALPRPQDFVHALSALFAVREGENLTLAGGDTIGWFAAFAETFLDIDVQLVSPHEELLFERKGSGRAQLQLAFIDHVTNSSSTTKTQNGDKIVLVMSSVGENSKSICRLPFTGRVAWDGVLPRVFGTTFQMLAHQESKTFVQAMGGASRAFQLLAEQEGTFVSPENRGNKASQGLGLVQTLMNWFPELRHLQGRLERLQSLAPKETYEKCNTGARGLIDLCGCTICAAPCYTDRDSGALPQSFCLLAVMETILNLGLAMSRITVVPRVYPSRAGIICVYQRQVAKLLLVKTDPPQDGERMEILFGNDWNANYSRRLQNAAAIFSGSWPKNDLPENLVALSHEGICTYVTSIQKGSPSKDDAGLIRIQTGNIVWNQKTYDRACLGYPEGVEKDDYTWEEVTCRHLSQKLYLK